MEKIRVLITVLIAFMLLSCSDSFDSNEEEKLKEAKIQYFKDLITNDSNEEFLILLSIKYNLNKNSIRKIINEFKDEDLFNYVLSSNEIKTLHEFEQYKKNHKKPAIEDIIRVICTEENVEPSKIASLLIDYKIWYAAQNHYTD